MKTRNEIIENATQAAYKYVMSGQYILDKRTRGCVKGDLRTIWGKIFSAKVNLFANQYESQSIAAYEKHAARRKAKVNELPQLFVNVLQNGMWLDYRNNRGSNMRVFADHLNFGLRNHWINNRQDAMALAVINKISKQTF